MATLEDGFRAYAASHPKPAGLPSWHDECGKLQYEWNSSFTADWHPAGSITTAAHVMANSTLFFPVSVNDITPGRFIFFSLPGTPDGHVGQVLAGRGLDAICGWASDALTEPLGAFIGLGTPADYIKKKNATFLGVSEDYAGALPNLAAFSGGGSVTPITDPVEDDMATEMVWYVNAASTDGKVTADSVYYQRSAGDALVLLGTSETSSEYTQLEQKLMTVPSLPVGNLYTPISGNGIQTLIGLRGLVGSYAQTSAGSDLSGVTGGITALATAVGQSTSALQTSIAGVPAATVKAQGAALSNG